MQVKVAGAERRYILYYVLRETALARPRAGKVIMRPLAIVAASVIVIVSIGPVLAAGDVRSGGQLAKQWCTSCHIVDRSEKGPDTAPPFPAIARRHPQNDGWVRAWLSTPHPPMPNFDLSRAQIDDIVAYLESFR